MRALAKAGAVLGVDVGFSPARRSSAVCRLDWTCDALAWTVARFRALEPERTSTLARLADRPLAAAAFDGPLAPGFGIIARYREAERALTRGIGRRIGKPGSPGAPIGRALNAAANACAEIVRASGQVAPARHREAIDAAAIIEAFPTAALGLMIEAPETLNVRRSDRTDIYYEHLADIGRLDAWLTYLLPGRRLSAPFAAVTDHDERAALVCALVALGLAAEAYLAVGDTDGWIVLPPRALLAGWADPLLSAAAAPPVPRGVSLLSRPKHRIRPS